MNDLAFVSTFTGGGGLDLGLERAGIRIIAMCESDAKARGVLKRHWPGIPCHDDIRTLRVESTAGSQADGSLAEPCDFRRADAGTIPAGIDEWVEVSTIESKGGSLPLGETESPWIGETCAWEYNPQSRERGSRLIFGPDYHSDDLPERHIEAIRAVMAGHAYIDDHREAQDND